MLLPRVFGVLAGAVLAAGPLAGCTSVVDGTPARGDASTITGATGPRPSSPQPTSTPTSGTPATTAPATASTTAPPAAGTPCPGTDAVEVVACLNSALSSYWTRTLGTPVRFVAVAEPTAAQVPKDCRSGLSLHTAFTCPADNNVYVTRSFIAGLRAVSPSTDLALRLTATMSHEAGHVVQLVEKFGPILHGKGDAQSRLVEQQADCLSGVWAHGVGIPAAEFLRGADVVLHYVDNAFERRTHGTVAVRLRQIQRGLAGHTAQSCGLTVR